MEILEEIKKDKIIQKYKYPYTWLSGENTTVYPIMIYKNKDGSLNTITIQLNTDKNIFKKLIERYKNKYKDIQYAYFWKSDGSCPSRLVFDFRKF